MRLLAALAVACSLLANASPARAGEEEDRVEAVRRYKRGMARFHLNEYDQAIEEFAAAYRSKADPVFLYNIAQAHRLAERPEPALEYYDKYLKVAENPPNKAEVEGRIADLRKLIEDKGRVLGSTPSATLPPGKGSTGEADKAPEKTPEKRAEVPAAALQPDAAPSPPVYKRWWFWTAAAVVVVAAGAGIGAAAATSGGPHEHGLPSVMAQ